ncbi:hypothetical protein CAPTEDRAFT_228244 [Capitella teleta]|uniref:ATP synthase F1 subunit epsilon n=1 Tax=Capitella teleta TaxID=283909 RepID=R7TEH5_CAPTE|nr:hypothetical protein CAPTEDRAFT_228244 [Capitella teleta]|eukprot:ELT92129.1 hypothetical protein CAPTEDRAFT_228244 [Capitella teleta]
MALRLLRFTNPIRALCQVRMSSSDSQQPGWGAGAGKGGGAGGSVREAGGGFGKMEAAHEEQYFRQLQAEQLAKLKSHHEDEIAFLEKEVKEQEQQEQLAKLAAYHKDEIEFLEKEVKEGEDEIQRHKKKIADLKKMAEEATKH